MYNFALPFQSELYDENNYSNKKNEKVSIYIIATGLSAKKAPTGWAAEIEYENTEFSQQYLSGGLPFWGSHTGILAGIGEALERIPSQNDVVVYIHGDTLTEKLKMMIARPFPSFKEKRPEFEARIQHHAKRLRSLDFVVRKCAYHDSRLLRLLMKAQEKFLEEMQQSSLPCVMLFADGSAKNTTGGWCAQIHPLLNEEISGNVHTLVGGDTYTNSQEMEQAGIMAGLESLEERHRVLIFFDYKQLKSFLIANEFNKERIFDLFLLKHKIYPFWIPGHVGLKLHDSCDEISRKIVNTLI